MKKVISKYENLIAGEKISRKDKLFFFGRRMKKRDLQKKNDQLKESVLEVGHNYFTHCHKCGCEVTYTIDHEAPCPEMWIEYFCLRCHSLIAYVDNSPLILMLDPDLNFN